MAFILFFRAALEKLEGRPDKIITIELGNWIRNERSSVLKTIQTKNVGEVYPTADSRLLRMFGKYMQKEIGREDYYFYDRTTTKAKILKRQLTQLKSRMEVERFLQSETLGDEQVRRL
jgi:hypothetical protein